jgi:hypothetical protein
MMVEPGSSSPHTVVPGPDSYSYSPGK